MIGYIVSALQIESLRPYWRKLYVEFALAMVFFVSFLVGAY
jgi:hypothetical protein